MTSHPISSFITNRLRQPISGREWHLAFSLALAGTVGPFIVTLLIVKTPQYETNPVVAYIIFELGWAAAAIYNVGLVLVVFVVGWWAESTGKWLAARAAIWPFTTIMVYNVVVDVRALYLVGILTTPDTHNRVVAIASIGAMAIVATIVYRYWYVNMRAPISK